MMRFVPLCLALVIASAAGRAIQRGGKAGAQDSVIQKVVEMLQDNKMKIKADLEKEEAEMAAYSKFCDDTSSEKEYSIKTTGRQITDLMATIADAKATIATTEDEITTVGTEIANKDGELAAATEVRNKGKADFEVTEKALVLAVDQLERAVVLIKRGTGFLQMGTGTIRPSPSAEGRALAKLLGKIIDAAWVDHSSAKVLKGFLQQQDNAASDAEDDLKLEHKQEPAPTSGGIVETLEEMKEKAEETLSNARTGEMKENHNFKMMAQSLTDSIAISKQKLSDAQATKAGVTQDAGAANGEMVEAQKTKAADTTYLISLKQECESAAEEWVEREKSGKAEMAAIDKAKEILMERVKVFFVQTGVNDPNDDEDQATTIKRRKLISQLKALGHSLQSYALMELAGSAAADPFEKVRGLITDMIAKLVEEANAEASQKSFCDEEKAKSKTDMDEKSMRSDQLNSRIESAASKKAELELAIKQLQEEVAKSDAGVAEATKMRGEEHAGYLQSSKDYKEGAAAVEQAIRVLKEYYDGLSFVQTSNVGSQRQRQPAFGGAKSDASSTIIAILENSGAEFTKMYMQIETDERQAVAAFEKMMDESKVAKATKLEEIKGAQSEIKSLDVALTNSGEDLKMVTKELDAVMSYMEKLKPQCETKAMSYEEKKARRDAEVNGLKEALSILDSSALLQKSLRSAKRH